MKKHFCDFRLWLDRTISGGIWKQILMAAGLFGIVFIIMGAAYSIALNECAIGRAFADMSSGISLRSILYGIDSTGKPFPGNILVWLAYILGTILLSGVLIATITNALRTRADRFRNGDVHYRFRNHYLFLGYEDLMVGMIQSLCQETSSHIVIAVSDNVAEYAEKISTRLDEKERRRVVVLRANRCNRGDLKRLRIHNASGIYIIGETGEETHDTLNMNCFHTIYSLCGKECMPECHVNIAHQSTFALFQTFVQSGDPDFDTALQHLHTFNFFDEWARLMVSGEYIESEELKLDSRSEEDNIGNNPEKQVHLVIAGMTPMGVALAREAAFICHYPGFVTSGMKTKITFVDKTAREKMVAFVGNYHHLFAHCCYSFRKWNAGGWVTEVHNPPAEKDFLDIEVEFIEANIDSSALRNELELWSVDPGQYLTLAICFEMSHHGIATALYLPDAVVESHIPVWVYQPTQGDLASYLKGSRFSNIVAFGMSGRPLANRINSKNLLYAQRLNHFYWHLDQTEVDYTDKETILNEWNAGHIYDRWSSLYNVAAIPSKLRGIGGIEQLEERIEDIAQVEHNRWNVEKLLMGFRATTDAEHAQVVALGSTEKKRLKNRFIHDDIRPFAALPQDIADIDRRFSMEIPKIIKKP